MKKMLNFKYVIVGFLLVLCGACSDFLDLEPKNKGNYIPLCTKY